MSRRLAGGVRNWPLSVKVVTALTCALLPLGGLATIITADAFRSVAAEGDGISFVNWLSVAAPLLMWLASLLIGWIVADRLLVEPLMRMRRVVELYGAGATTLRLGDTEFLSQEVTALAAAFDRMADDIGRHDRELNAALVEQKRLTREVHHRVKNNLQIVSSLLSIQSRETSNSEVARAYSTVQARVGALALVHRWMYDDDTAKGVDLQALASDLCASLQHSIAAGEGVRAHLKCTVDRFRVDQDTAVPVAFLVTEIVSLAARLSAPAALDITVAARAVDGDAVLTICSPLFHEERIAGNPDAAARIIQGMARQLRSPLRHDPVEGSYSIRFPIPGDA